MSEINKTAERIIKELDQAINEYQEIEKDIYNRALKVFKSSMSQENHLSSGWRYFHILKQYIYEKLQISHSERMLVGKITFCYGALIEIADDMSDDQFVWSVPFNIPFLNPRLNLATQMWMVAKVLEDYFQEYRKMRKWGFRTFTDEDIALAQKSIFDHLCKMGAEVIKHEHSTGEILSPEVLEKGLINAEGGYHDQMIPVILEALRASTPFNLADLKENFRWFGIGIEMLADAADMMENIEDKKHNYFISFIHHKGTPEEKQILTKLLIGDFEQTSDPYLAFSSSLNLVRLRAYRLIFTALWPYYSKLTNEEKQMVKGLVLLYEPPLPFAEKRHALKSEFYRQLEERLNK